MCSARRLLHRCRISRQFRQDRIPPDDPTAPTDSEISISEALRRVLQELGISLPEIRDVDVQRVHVGGRDAYHITFTANGKPYSFFTWTPTTAIFSKSIS